MTPSILIAGASGPTGGAVSRAVAARGGVARGISRHPQDAAAAARAGVHDFAVADLRNTAALEQAMRGMTSAFYFSPRAEPDEASLGRAFIACAERAGVRRVVIISMLQSHAPVPNHEASLEVEKALSRTSLEHVVLQPAMFMQTLPSPAALREYGWVGRPYSVDQPLSWIHMDDLAEVAARAVLTDDLVNGTFELCSTGMLSIAQIAELATIQLGKKIAARRITLEEWAVVRGEGFASPYRRETYTAMFEHFDKYGYKGGNSLVLRHLLGREPVTFSEHLARGAAASSH